MWVFEILRSIFTSYIVQILWNYIDFGSTFVNNTNKSLKFWTYAVLNSLNSIFNCFHFPCSKYLISIFKMLVILLTEHINSVWKYFSLKVQHLTTCLYFRLNSWAGARSCTPCAASQTCPASRPPCSSRWSGSCAKTLRRSNVLRAPSQNIRSGSQTTGDSNIHVLFKAPVKTELTIEFFLLFNFTEGL